MTALRASLAALPQGIEPRRDAVREMARESYHDDIPLRPIVLSQRGGLALTHFSQQ